MIHMFTCLQRHFSAAETRGCAWRKRISACRLTNAQMASNDLTIAPEESHTACILFFPLDGVYIALTSETAKQQSPAGVSCFVCPLHLALLPSHAKDLCFLQSPSLLQLASCPITVRSFCLHERHIDVTEDLLIKRV